LEILKRFISEPSRCGYLPQEIAILEHLMLQGVSPPELEQFLERGWRRFGMVYFRPACTACNACVSLRVPVHRFKPSQSQSKVLRRGRFRLEVGRPAITAARIELYNRWQAKQGALRNWNNEPIDAERYFLEFAIPHPAAREFAFYDDTAGLQNLIAVGLVDETPNALSAVYTYFDPDYARFSPGTLCILRQIEYANEKDKRFVYLGYRVTDCASSRYKSNFRPHQLLTTRPGMDEAPAWEP
jgi:arginyl-tRNA--protein-N-Asp/Glu arginylyltransferase